jgi:hypothetical protein
LTQHVYTNLGLVVILINVLQELYTNVHEQSKRGLTSLTKEANMITEELIEKLDLPDYESWVEHIWTDDYWWDWIIDETAKEWADIGIDIQTYQNKQHSYPQITFDIHRGQCASKGSILDDDKFYTAYQDRLMAISPVYAQMFKEGYIYVTWESSRNGWLEVSVNDSYIDEQVFTSGLFAGTSVREMYESELVAFDDFEDCVTEIIKDLHDELLSKLTSTYEYDTSEERYKEWIMEQINEAV